MERVGISLYANPQPIPNVRVEFGLRIDPQITPTLRDPSLREHTHTHTQHMADTFYLITQSLCVRQAPSLESLITTQSYLTGAPLWRRQSR